MSRVGRLIRGTGILTIAALALSACGGTGFDQSTATKVIQSVDVNLDPAGAITEVASNAVYLDELSGSSNNSTDTFTVEDVVEDLPVRVSTQYKTDDGGGSNLEDLEGHTGRVEIAVTVENLTLNSSELTYDVAGESRQSSALIGTPLSVAGSVELEDTTASNVLVDVESETTTNGVVSQNTDGDAIVQWGTVLAPPQSEATTTFRLVADVEDFSTPEFDLAVQAGFHTDMSFEGMLTSAFDTSAGSEYGMQQKAIELVADINEVLTRAGTTITEIRQNLDHTTDTLGVDAAQQLRQNSDDMVTEMQRVGEQLTALESQVDSSMSGAETAMNSQLSQIVASMSGMMGNTDATAPKLVTGQGCAATVEDAKANGSLYSTFLILGAQLDGYAQANAECRDEIVTGIQRTLGPEVPDVKKCEANSTSITCALFAAQNSVLTSLNELVDAGEQIIEKLDEQDVSNAQQQSENIAESLRSIQSDIDRIRKPEKKSSTPPQGAVSDQRPVTWRKLNRDIKSARANLASLKNDLKPRQKTAIEEVRAHVEDMKGDFKAIDVEAGEISQRHAEIAQRICDIEIADENGETTERDLPSQQENNGGADESGVLDDLSLQLVGLDCDKKPAANDEASSEVSLNEEGKNIETSLSERLNSLVDETYIEELNTFGVEQDAHWEAALDELDVNNDDSAVAELDSALKKIQEDLKELRKEDRRIMTEIDSIEESVFAAQSHHIEINASLDAVMKDYEEGLPEDIREAFQKVVDDTAKELPERVDSQVRIVTDRISNAEDAVTNSYNTTIAGLTTTSDAVVNGTADQLDGQKATLEAQQGETTEALNKSTTAVLESIHQSTTSSTRDLEGASAQLGASLTNVILDLGDPEMQGSGILGSMSASSAMSDTADYQLALASQRAAGYANVRSEDIAEIMLRQAQFSASLEAAGALPAFHLDAPAGARTQTIYAFHIGGDSK